MKNLTSLPLFKRLGTKNAFTAIFACATVILLLLLTVFSLMPRGATLLDITKNDEFSLSPEGKALASEISDEVTLYLITSGGADHTRTRAILEKYALASPRVTVRVLHAESDLKLIKNYVSYNEYCDGGVIAVSGKRSVYIAPHLMLSYSDSALSIAVSYYSQYASSDSSMTFSSFLALNGAYFGLNDGYSHEQKINAALRYVTSDNVARLGFISGSADEYFSDAILFKFAEALIETVDLTAESGLSDLDGILIMPTDTDISVSAKNQLSDYISKGGNVVLLSSYGLGKGYENLSSLCAEMGLSASDGYVFEDDTKRYYSSPETILPTALCSSIPSVTSDLTLFLPLCNAINVSDELPLGVQVTPLIVTSDTSYVKTELKNGYVFDSETDLRAKRSVAVKAENASGGQLCYIASSFILTEDFNYYSDGANHLVFFSLLKASMLAEADLAPSSAPVREIEVAYISPTEGLLYGTIAIGIIIALASIAVGMINGFRRNK